MKYKTTITIDISAHDDVEARKWAKMYMAKIVAAGIKYNAIKLQAIYENEPPRRVEI